MRGWEEEEELCYLHAVMVDGLSQIGKARLGGDARVLEEGVDHRQRDDVPEQ